MAAMHHALTLASRIVAGVVAGIAFYFAFFLYEDEEGKWHNRIENLWAAVYDRAKVTDSTSTALFNRIGETLKHQFDALFGTRLISFQSFTTSVCLSMAGAIATLGIIGLFHKNTSFDIWDWPLCLLLLLFTIFGGPWGKRRLDLTLYFLGVSILLIFLVVVSWDLFNTPLKSQPVLLFGSVLSDYIALVVMRKLFSSLVDNVSITRLIFLITSLSLTALLIEFGPSLAYGIYEYPYPISDITFTFKFTYEPVDMGKMELTELIFLNVSTCILFLIPVATLIVVFIHKLIWPVLSRLLYPIASRRIVTNRKVLIPLGILALTFAFNLEHVGAKELLKLLAS